MCRQEPVKCRIFGLRGFLIAAGRIFGISGISVSTEIYFRVVFAKNFPSCVPRAGTPTRRHALGRLPTPPPLPENLLSDCTENCPLRPCEHPGGSESEKSASHSGHSPLRGLGGGLGDASPARRGSPSRTASPPAPLAIRKAPSGRRRKSRRQSHKFFKHLLRLAPQLAATPWGGSPPRPLCQKICYSDCTENCPLRPLRAPRRFRNPKIGQQLGAQPTPRFRWRFRWRFR